MGNCIENLVKEIEPCLSMLSWNKAVKRQSIYIRRHCKLSDVTNHTVLLKTSQVLLTDTAAVHVMDYGAFLLWLTICIENGTKTKRLEKKWRNIVSYHLNVLMLSQ